MVEGSTNVVCVCVCVCVVLILYTLLYSVISMYCTTTPTVSV